MKNIKGLWIVLLVGASVSQAHADSQRVIEINSVKAAISKRGAKWTPRESWVSRLPKEDMKRMLGVQRAPQGVLDFESTRVRPSRGAPPVIDWRNYNGTNWLGPVMNQGNCGSCVAFATVATLEARTSIAGGNTWLHPTFSPQHLFACGGGSCESGWMPGSAADFLLKTGVTDEACMPYTSGSTGSDVSCSQKCGDATDRSLKVTKTTTPSSFWSGGSVDSVKAALVTGPLVTTLTVYADFMNYGGGIYKHVTGDALGGHAVSLVGYDNSKRAWLIRNSWGEEWGEKGFAWVSWDDMSGVGAETWGFVVKPAANLSVTAPLDREFVSGQYNLVSNFDGVSNSGLHFQILDDRGSEVGKYACVSRAMQSCTVGLDTTTLKDGRYEIIAKNSAGIKSQTREFFVINTVPQLSLSFNPISGVDLSQPVTGRPEFNISAQSGAVPMQHIEFRVFDSNGKIAATKSNDYVEPQMKMGWRTITVPNGAYTLQVHGETHYLGKLYTVDSNSYQITVKN